MGSNYSKGGDDSSVSSLREQFAGAKIRASGGGSGAGAGDERAQAVLDRLRKQMASRGANGIAGIARAFKIMDDDRNRVVDADEFRKAMRDFGVTTSDPELELLFNYLDRDGGGTIDFDELLTSLRVRGCGRGGGGGQCQGAIARSERPLLLCAHRNTFLPGAQPLTLPARPPPLFFPPCRAR